MWGSVCRYRCGTWELHFLCLRCNCGPELSPPFCSWWEHKRHSWAVNQRTKVIESSPIQHWAFLWFRGFSRICKDIQCTTDHSEKRTPHPRLVRYFFIWSHLNHEAPLTDASGNFQSKLSPMTLPYLPVVLRPCRPRMGHSTPCRDTACFPAPYWWVHLTKRQEATPAASVEEC